MKHAWYEMIMAGEEHVQKQFFPRHEEFFGIDTRQLTSGNIVECWNNNSYLQSASSDDDGELADVIFTNAEMIPVLSPRVQEALSGLKIATRDIQYLQVRIIQSNGLETRGFAVANVLARVSALNRNKSYLLVEEPQKHGATQEKKILAVGKLAVVEEPLKGHHLARLIEFPKAVLVSQRIVDVFLKHEFTGVTFTPLIVS